MSHRATIRDQSSYIGVTAKLLDRLRHPLWSAVVYLAMGWVALVAAGPRIERMSDPGTCHFFAALWHSMA